MPEVEHYRTDLNWNLLEIKPLIEWWAAFHVYIISKANFKLKVETFFFFLINPKVTQL